MRVLPTSAANGPATRTAGALERPAHLRRHGTRALVAHLGDSRAYLCCEQQLLQLTQDHSLVQGMVDAGELDAADAKHHPARNEALAQILGEPRGPDDTSAALIDAANSAGGPDNITL